MAGGHTSEDVMSLALTLNLQRQAVMWQLWTCLFQWLCLRRLLPAPSSLALMGHVDCKHRKHFVHIFPSPRNLLLLHVQPTYFRFGRNMFCWFVWFVSFANYLIQTYLCSDISHLVMKLWLKSCLKLYIFWGQYLSECRLKLLLGLA